MFCTKCGNKMNTGASFCNGCGTKAATPSNNTSSPVSEPVISPANEPAVLNNVNHATLPAEQYPVRQSSALGLCISMCILRFADALFWTFMVILQISFGFEFRIIIWNIAATGISYFFAVQLLGACRPSVLPDMKVANFARRNRQFSFIAAIWYIAQVAALYADNILIISAVVQVLIIAISTIILSKFWLSGRQR